ncbi:hypothetical protein QYH69_29140 [Paraburkholderia sp. SARCC-3016]|uniref:hypothetical protein n=1 Tax=Paraburkholderia sp. SARCC-3016 TaxID=3058611 RepID=UPI0028089ABF|nr:hypothetical protein [Paraburkholderia sp. SARCC-3016]MDQ7981303.1 hypothetical protein [Paraburkholderia sp. SARCC-3016]
MKTTALSVALCVSVAACGSSKLSSESGTTTVIQSSAGIYTGPLSTQQRLTLLAKLDGSAYLFYRTPSAARPAIDDVVVVGAAEQAQDGKYQSKQATRYRLVHPRKATPVQVNIDFARSPAISGFVAVPGDKADNVAFNASPTLILGEPPSLSSIQGLYSGTGSSLQGASATQVTITSSGLLAGQTANGCEFRGTLTPSSGVTAYDVSATYSGAPCIDANATVSGAAVLDESQLLLALPRANRSDVFVFAGKR